LITVNRKVKTFQLFASPKDWN